MDIALYTIGSAGKTAKEFFEILRQNSVRKVIDVRLYNRSQLAGFTKSDDLRYFLRSILDVGYEHQPILAPSKELLDGYKKGGVTWGEYEREYIAILQQRKPDAKLNREEFDGACLLCSEASPNHCHRRLAAEFLARKWGNVKIVHLTYERMHT